MPYRVEAEAVLSLWREVERELLDVPAESDESALLVEQWALLRAEYQRLTDEARKHHRPEPDPWPDAADDEQTRRKAG